MASVELFCHCGKLSADDVLHDGYRVDALLLRAHHSGRIYRKCDDDGRDCGKISDDAVLPRNPYNLYAACSGIGTWNLLVWSAEGC